MSSHPDNKYKTLILRAGFKEACKTVFHTLMSNDFIEGKTWIHAINMPSDNDIMIIPSSKTSTVREITEAVSDLAMCVRLRKGKGITITELAKFVEYGDAYHEAEPSVSAIYQVSLLVSPHIKEYYHSDDCTVYTQVCKGHEQEGNPRKRKVRSFHSSSSCTRGESSSHVGKIFELAFFIKWPFVDQGSWKEAKC